MPPSSAICLRQAVFLGLTLLTWVQPASSLAQVLITEFAADNSTLLADEDGDHPDWLELSNFGASPVSLDGWCLTDDPGDLTKWRIPALTLPARSSVVVFASGKNRTNTIGRLHTNFSLNASGEYLALVMPDGTSIAHHYTPAYPPQHTDITYGLSFNLSTNSLHAPGQLARFQIPPDASFPSTWTLPSHNDSSWPLASAPFGYESGTSGFQSLIATDLSSGLRNINASACFRLPLADPGTNTQSLVLNVRYDDGFIAYLNGTAIASRNAPGNPTWNAAATQEHPNPQAVQFEAIDVSAVSGLLTPTSNLLAIQGLNISAGDEDFLLDAGLTAYDLELLGERFFSTPSPGALNTTGFVAFVADTRFSVDRGYYSNAFDLELSCATPDARIYWTTNGTVPTPSNGFLYTTNSPIRIAGTTTLRAASYLAGYQPSNVDTHSYLFTADIIRQAANGAAPTGWPSSWGANTVDYGMDPNVVSAAPWSNTIQDDLKSLPCFSIVMNLNDLFNASTGIYANPGQDGALWERPCSLELIYPDGSSGFHLNAGLRIRGGFSRSTSNPKHAFRFFFRQSYGTDKLRYEMFGDDGADKFDALDLRTFQNYSWSFQGDSTGTFLRDQVNRDLQLAMGHQAERGNYYHLYINGFYWGLFNTCERPEASYGATYYGGLKENFDVIKVEAGVYTINATDGNMAAWTRLYNLALAGLATDAACEFILGNNPDGTRNPSFEALIDADNLIDYMLVILYGGNLDAPISNFLGNTSPNNWYGLRDRTGTNGFRFFVHDAEHTLLNVNEDRTGPYSAGDSSVYKSNPQWVWQKLLANPEFKLRTADRIHRHCFNNGVLTPARVATFVQRRTNEIFRAVVAESARWGDAKREPPLTRNDWLNAVNSTLNSYAPQRTTVLLNQLRSKGIYPNVVAPTFNQHGGAIPPGFALSMSAPAGTLYYTLNGMDPRTRGGTIYQGAQAYAAPVTLTQNITVKARVRDASGNWSALNEADFTLIQTWRDLLITEIMYHPAGTPGVDADDFEFIELKNTGTNQLDLSGVTFTNGIRYTFPRGRRLDPGRFVVLVANPAAFTNRYPGVAYDDVYTGHLANAGELLALNHAAGAPIFAVSYSDAAPWPLSADGGGFSLVPVLPNANPDPLTPGNWRASSQIGGSPGQDDPPSNVPPVWITEVLTHTDPPQLDSIELYNPNTTHVDIGGWYLSDDRNSPRKFRLPSPTLLGPGAYTNLDEQDFNPVPGVDPSFNLSSYGEEVYLNSADEDGNLTGFTDGFAFPTAANGVSFGRHVISTGEAQYPPQTQLTLGQANSGPVIGPIVINEIHYHPLPGDPEFVELLNISSTNVPLFDPEHPANTWHLEGLALELPTGLTLPPGGILLLSESPPDLFRARHSLPAELPVVGPFPGFLENNGETLRLQRPDKPDLLTNGTVFVPYIDVDIVRYDSRHPWPPGADGSGASLERLTATAYGNDPANWRASPGEPSPGYENNGNRRPAASAGQDLSIAADSSPIMVGLSGVASDDGLPAPALDVRWHQLGGPGPVDFLDDRLTNTTARFPGVGTYQLQLTVSDGQFSASDTVLVDIQHPTSDFVLIAPGSTWRYWDRGSLPAADWNTPDYLDTSWSSGPSELGYGDGDEATTVSYGPDGNAKYPTTYFRRSFMVTNRYTIQSLTLDLVRDDGAVIYLNGVEVLRTNMPVTTISYSTWASDIIGNAEEYTFRSFPIDTTSLVEGTNVVAVEIHQSGPTSSDLGFNLGLTAQRTGINASPHAGAGPDLTASTDAPLLLEGSTSDDGLPLPPGLLSSAWSVASGPDTVTFNPDNLPRTRASFATPGTYVLRLQASDGTLSASDFVTVLVNSGGFDSWRAQFFTGAELADPAISGPDADPDLDGHANQQEYVAGTHPRQFSSVLRFESATAMPGSVLLGFEAVAGRTYQVEFRTQVESGTWQILTNLPPVLTNTPVLVPHANPPGTVFYRLLIPAGP